MDVKLEKATTNPDDRASVPTIARSDPSNEKQPRTAIIKYPSKQAPANACDRVYVHTSCAGTLLINYPHITDSSPPLLCQLGNSRLGA